MVFLTAVTPLYAILTPTLLHTGYYIIPAIPAAYHVYNTTRVDIHIACICEVKGVWGCIARKLQYTIDSIYLSTILINN